MIKLVDLYKEYKLINNSLEKNIKKLHKKSSYILNKDVELLENKLSKFKETKFCVTCASGTDALVLSLMALELPRYSEVIIPSYSWISTASSVLLNNLNIKFIDIKIDDCCINIEDLIKKISKRTKAIIVADLYGNAVQTDLLKRICKNNNIYLIIDGAQSFGSKNHNKYFDIYTTSFFPAKSLGCFGDGGACFTNSKILEKKLKILRLNGQYTKYNSSVLGINSRLDSIQALVLLEKLKHYKKFIKKRREVAMYYDDFITNNFKNISIVLNLDQNINICTNFPILIKKRNIFIKFMKEKGVEIGKNYPIPLSKQKTFKDYARKGNFKNSVYVSNHIATLPINPFITRKDQNYILSCIYEFFKFK